MEDQASFPSLVQQLALIESIRRQLREALREMDYNMAQYLIRRIHAHPQDVTKLYLSSWTKLDHLRLSVTLFGMQIVSDLTVPEGAPLVILSDR